MVLLRLRAKTVGATYKRTWECLQNIKPQKFIWESSEGSGDACARQKALLYYIEQHLLLIDRYSNKIRLSEAASFRWKNANRSGGSRHRAWEELNKAIASELLRREDEVTQTARADEIESAQAQSQPLYPAQFAVDVKRIERELLAEELGVSKPTVKDKLKAAITNAYESNDLDKAKRITDQLERKVALELVKRRAKKARKRMIKQYRNRLDQTPDPNSDEDSRN